MIAAVELAILARLRAVEPALGFKWGTLATFPNPWETELYNDDRVRCPAAWVTFAGWNGAVRAEGPNGEPQLHVEASFGLMVADENLRPSEQYQRHGGADPAKEPGSYRLFLGAVGTLAGQMLGLDLVAPLECGPLRAVAATVADSKRPMSRYAVELTCTVPLAIAADGEVDPADLLALHANWELQPRPDPSVDADPVAPGVQLADDFHADATDTVSLGEQEP